MPTRSQPTELNRPRPAFVFSQPPPIGLRHSSSLKDIGANGYNLAALFSVVMNIESPFDRIFPPERAARLAVVFEHREITYEELRAATVRAAEALHALGIGQGDRV